MAGPAGGGRVLVARMDSLGDVLAAGPAVRAVAAAARDVVLLCGPRGRAAAELLPGAGQVVCWRAPWIDPEPGQVSAADVEALVRRLAGLDVDAALILTSFHQSALPLALLLRLAGVRWIGAASVDYPGSLLDLRVRVDETEDVPEPVRALRIAAAAGYLPPPGDDGRLAVRRPLPDVAALTGPPGYVVVHPGASVPARAWPAERFRETVAGLVAQGHRVVVTGSPGERWLTAYVAGGGGEVVDLGGRVNFAGLAAVLAGATCVVVANTGPAHLAAAVRTPVVSLFAPTVPAARWAPYGVPVVLLGDQDAPCRGSRARECPVPGHPCLAGVPAAAAIAAVGELAGVPV